MVLVGGVPQSGSSLWVQGEVSEILLRLSQPSLLPKPVLWQHIYFCCKGDLQVCFQSSTTVSSVQHGGLKSRSIWGEKVKEEAKLLYAYVTEKAP